MRELDKEFEGVGEVSGATFRQIKMSSWGYVYEITDNETEDLRYEVFQRKEQKEGSAVIGGVVCNFEAKVIYPKSGAFGIWAWGCRSKEKAVGRFLKEK